MQVNGHEYPLISDTVFNAFNVLSVVAMLSELGYKEETIADFLKGQTVTKIREDGSEV